MMGIHMKIIPVLTLMHSKQSILLISILMESMCPPGKELLIGPLPISQDIILLLSRQQRELDTPILISTII